MIKHIFSLSFIIVYTFSVNGALYPDRLVFLSPRYGTSTGIRQSGMGYTGFSCVQDENSVAMNPAGLGMHNDRFKRLGCMYSLVPRAQKTGAGDDIFYEQSFTLCSQPSLKNVGGFGLLSDLAVWRIGDAFNDIVIDTIVGMPRDTTTDKIHLYTSTIVAYGHDLSFIRCDNHALGLGIRYIHFYQSDSGNKRRNNAISMDVGYAGTFFSRLHIGMVFSHLNMYLEKKRYNYEEIPGFTGAVGVSDLLYQPTQGRLKLFIETNYTHHFSTVFEEYDLWRNEIVNTGFAMGIFNFLFIRSGLSYDFFSHDKIVPWGFGLNFFNRYELNFFHTAYTTQDVDRKRFGFSVGIINLFE